MDTNEKPSDTIEAKLGLWDAVSIIVGIIIGVGIFWTPPGIFASAPNAAVAIGLWVLGGVFALVGALCFAELAAAYPRSGGEYVYITRAFGPFAGFLFAWSQLTVTRSGNIAGMAYIFGQKAASLFGMTDDASFALAGAVVAGLTIVNIVGVRMGTGTQNVLTVAKILGIAVLIIVGFAWERAESAPNGPAAPREEMWLLYGMIFVLWTYSGWHEAAYVVAEARNHTRNIPLALILGTTIVTVIYVLVNLAYLHALGFEGAKQNNIAEQVLDLVWPGYGARFMEVLIMISSLGAINGMIFTTGRIYSEFGKDHRIFKMLSHWSTRMKTPVRALAIQCLFTVAIIVGVWWIGAGDADNNNFERTVQVTVVVFWAFFCLTGVALIRLRETDPDTPRPFLVPGYPVVPIIFCATCAYIVIGTILRDFEKDRIETLLGVGILLVGLPFYFFPQKMKHQPAAPEPVETVDSSLV
ncbi:MAG: amino acid permease [Planctomycetes bacterium]|nr:amino acid permease [Planctomycetota bacterium]